MAKKSDDEKDVVKKEDRYFKLKNVIIDNLLGLPSGEFHIAMVLVRKTIGFRKGEDYISISQFIEITKMSKPTVIKHLKSLEKKKIVKKVKKRCFISKYTFNMNVKQWDVEHITYADDQTTEEHHDTKQTQNAKDGFIFL